MNILTYLQTKTKADDLSIRIANVLMVLGIVCGINAMVAMNALRDDRVEEMERRRRDDWDGLADWNNEEGEDQGKTKRLQGGIYVSPEGRLYTRYVEEVPETIETRLIIATK